MNRTADRISQPVIVLVEPQLGENIGMAARAMLNTGLTDLRLVKPRDGWPNSAATRASSGAEAVIEEATVYETLADAVADKTLVIATTARHRDMAKPIWRPDTAVTGARKNGLSSTAILFGRERSGLSTQEITHADAILNIPLNPEKTSLNLAQAVLLVGYHFWQDKHKHDRDERSEKRDSIDMTETGMVEGLYLGGSDPAPKSAVENLIEHLLYDLDQTGFFPNENMRSGLVTGIRNTLHRMRLSAQETQVWHGIVKALSRYGDDWRKKE